MSESVIDYPRGKHGPYDPTLLKEYRCRDPKTFAEMIAERRERDPHYSPNFRGALLEGLGLHFSAIFDIDLSGADFSNSFLEGMSIDQVNLAGADFRRITTERTGFHYCDLRWADFGRAELGGATFVGCIFDSREQIAQLQAQGARIEKPFLDFKQMRSRDLLVELAAQVKKGDVPEVADDADRLPIPGAWVRHLNSLAIALYRGHHISVRTSTAVSQMSSEGGELSREAVEEILSVTRKAEIIHNLPTRSPVERQRVALGDDARMHEVRLGGGHGGARR